MMIKKHGYGTFTWNDGRKYIGQWVDSKQCGRGTFIKSNEETRIGEWIDGLYFK